MQEFVSAVCTLVVVGVGIAIIVGALKPEEALKRLMWVVVVLVCAGVALSLVAGFLLPVFLTVVERLAKCVIELAIFLLLVLVAIVVIAAAAQWVKKHFRQNRRSRHEG